MALTLPAPIAEGVIRRHLELRVADGELAPSPLARFGAAQVDVRPSGLGLTVDELEELLLAVGDREDAATTDARARLARGRAALERELAGALAD